MAGEAKTNSFLLATATVMIGPTDKLFDLNANDHSIGLVKNFSISATPTYTELTQGVKNTTVYSVMTANPVKATMEVYEYTSANLAYGLGLDGSTLETITTSDVLQTTIVGDGTTMTTAVVGALTDTSAAYPIGANIFIQELGGTDLIHLTKVASRVYAAESHTLTITMANAVPQGMTLDAGSSVSVINRINVGSKVNQPFLAAKIVGILPENNEPIILAIPKMRITKGFTLGFQSSDYANLPFEMTPYDLVAADPNYAEFNDGPVAIYQRG